MSSRWNAKDDALLKQNIPLCTRTSGKMNWKNMSELMEGKKGEEQCRTHYKSIKKNFDPSSDACKEGYDNTTNVEECKAIIKLMARLMNDPEFFAEIMTKLGISKEVVGAILKYLNQSAEEKKKAKKKKNQKRKEPESPMTEKAENPSKVPRGPHNSDVYDDQYAPESQIPSSLVHLYIYRSYILYIRRRSLQNSNMMFKTDLLWLLL